MLLILFMMLEYCVEMHILCCGMASRRGTTSRDSVIYGLERAMLYIEYSPALASLSTLSHSTAEAYGLVGKPVKTMVYVHAISASPCTVGRPWSS